MIVKSFTEMLVANVLVLKKKGLLGAIANVWLV
jgi:hypothetical protein